MEKHIQFLAVGDIVTDNFIELKDASVNCEIDHNNCKLCVSFGQKVPYENAIEIQAVGNSPNASVCASRLGLKSALTATVGNDTHGINCLEKLKKENVIVDFMNVSSQYPTNYHFVLRYGAERTILIKHAPFVYKLPEEENLKVDWLYFSSIGEHALEFHRQIVKWLESHPETKLAFQPGTFQIKIGTEKIKDIYKKTEVFFCNIEEAQTILNTKEKEINILTKGIHDLGPKKVVITDGPNGLYGSDGENIYKLPMYPDLKDPVDRTGAGDATSSTIIAMMANGLEFKEAIMYGPINAMSVVQYVGAQEGLLSKEKLEEYLKTAPEDYKTKGV